MGQQEILEFLMKKRGKPLSRGQIAEGLKEDKIKVSHLLKKLLIRNEIKCIEINRFEAREKLGIKRRIRLYYSS